MAWKVVTWSAATRTGAIGSPHFEGLPFGPEALAEDVELEVGEEVHARLGGEPGRYFVESIERLRVRSEEQPSGTACDDFKWLNAQEFGDLCIDESSTADRLALWVGYCCEWCRNSAILRFPKTAYVGNLDEDADWDDPYFRLATKAEIGGAAVPTGHIAYFVVITEYGPKNPKGILVVSERVEIEERPCRATAGWHRPLKMLRCDDG